MAIAGVSRYDRCVLRRLLLLLALLLALPATARPACHDIGAMPSVQASAHVTRGHVMSGHAAARRPGPAHIPAHRMTHDCLGCIPPAMLLGARVEAAPMWRTVPTRAVQMAFAPGRASAPTPPPPKNA